MAFVEGIRPDSPHGYKYTEVLYPEQAKALQDMKLEKAADMYWQLVRIYELTDADLQSAAFNHILEKRKPARLS